MPTSDINVFLRLIGGRRFEGGLLGAASATRGFSASIERATNASKSWQIAQHAGTAGLFAMAGAARVGSYAIGGLAIATLGFGFKFNATMEQSYLAFGRFTGSAKTAKRFVNDLFQIAAKSPFTFKDVTTAGRRLLAFGFDVKETTGLIKTLSDVVSYTGGNADATFRLAKAFGDIHAKGRLMQQEVNQLANVGIPAYDILRKKLHLTADDMRHIGLAGIGADKAIKALKEGLDERYGGGAAKYSKTFTGQLDKAKDYGERAAGALTKPLFKFVEKKILPSIIGWFKDINKWANGPGFKAFRTWLSEKAAPVIKDVGSEIYKLGKGLIEAFKPAMPFFKNVLLPLLKGLAIGLIASIIGAVKFITAAIKVIARVLGWIGTKAKPLKKVFEAIGFVVAFVWGGVILKALSKVGVALKWLGGVFKILSLPVRFVASLIGELAGVFGRVAGFIIGKFIGALRAVIGWLGGKLAPAGRLIGHVFRIATTPIRLMWAGLKAVGSIGIKVAGFLIGKVVGSVRAVGKAFGSIGRGIGSVVSHIWNAITGVFGKVLHFLSGLGSKMFHAGVGIAKAIGKGILNAFGSAVGFASDIGRKIADWLNDNTPLGDKVHIGIPGPIPDIDFRLPKLWTGGDIMSGGMAIVGDRGPELLSLPTGSSVVPMRPARVQRPSGGAGGAAGAVAAAAGPAFSPVMAHFTIPLYINDREIGRATGTYAARRKALG